LIQLEKYLVKVLKPLKTYKKRRRESVDKSFFKERLLPKVSQKTHNSG
jgi:hypothetical protein